MWDSFAGYSDMAALNDGQGVIMIFENGKKTFADSVCVHVRSLLFTYHSCYTLIAATIDSCSDLCALLGKVSVAKLSTTWLEAP